MNLISAHFSNYCRKFVFFGLLAGMALLTGCSSMYVDTATKEIPVSEFRKVQQPKPVHLTFEFQSKGAPNAQATAFLKDAVVEQIKKSGLFSSIVAAPSPGVAMLSVSLNNVPLTDDAAAQGFVTGLTFGLAGSAVSDGYVCTVNYLQPGQTQAIVATAKHAIHTTLGNAAAPAGAVKAESAEQAVRKMTREVLSNALRDLSQNTSFN
jgi:hypothetical protein